MGVHVGMGHLGWCGYVGRQWVLRTDVGQESGAVFLSLQTQCRDAARPAGSGDVYSKSLNTYLKLSTDHGGIITGR